jgi:hypothetical protein
MGEIMCLFDLNTYHWVWYSLGFLFCPRLTIMIWITIYFRNILPLPLMILGWIFALLQQGVVVKTNK